jgi:UDP-glucose 4-epimerase
MNQSSILVTGGGGFIGSHLVSRLVSPQHKNKIYVLDSFEFGSADNLQLYAEKNNITILSAKLGTKEAINELKKIDKVDYVFHLAAQKHNQSKHSPRTVITENIQGTQDLLDLCADWKPKRVVFSSSLYVYGKLSLPPFSENDLCTPRTVYGTSKVAGENLLHVNFEKHQIPYSVLRYFFVYGPKQFAATGYKSVIVKNFQRIKQNLEPIIFGSGEQTLDYIYVDDVVEATLKSAFISEPTFLTNIGSGKGISVNELVNLMLKVSACSAKPIYDAPDWTEGSSRVANITRMKEKLNWSPPTDLLTGLTKTWNWICEKENK